MGQLGGNRQRFDGQMGFSVGTGGRLSRVDRGGENTDLLPQRLPSYLAGLGIQ